MSLSKLFGMRKMSKQEKIRRIELEYGWDGERRREVLIARRMNFDDPVEVYRDYEREKLREIFRNQIAELDKLNRNFWKVILGISDEEFNNLVEEDSSKDCSRVQLNSMGVREVNRLKEIKKKELRYAWDGERNREILILRRMNWDNPIEVYRDYGREKLRKLYRENLHSLTKVNRSFWKVILGISDEEFNRLTRENFRLHYQIWPY